MPEPRQAGRPDVLAEIGTKGDFPAAARIIQRLNESVRRDDCKTAVVARTILQDPGLSSKVLRVVNSVLYRHGADPIATISRAVVLLGFDAIRDLTAGILLMDQVLPAGKVGGWVRDAFTRSLRCGFVAQAVSARVGYPNPEEAYLLGLFANLGALWLAAHYPAAFADVQVAMDRDGLSLDAATTRVFGVQPSDVAARILSAWEFPARYARYFLSAAVPEARVRDPEAVLAATVGVAAEYTRAGGSPAAALERFQTVFGLPPEIFAAAMRAGDEAFQAQAPAFGNMIAKSALVRESEPAARRSPAPIPPAPPSVAQPGAPASADAPSALAVVAEITQAILAHENINDVLSMVLEGLARAGRHDCVLLALLTPGRDRIVGRLGFGDGAAEFLRTLVVPLRPGAGALAEAILSRAPRVASTGGASDLVPAGAPTGALRFTSFIACPLVVRGKAVGAVIAARTGPPAVAEPDLALVQLFASQAGLALDRAAG